MKKTQKVNHYREKIERQLYAVEVWNTLSEAQQDAIYEEMSLRYTNV